MGNPKPNESQIQRAVIETLQWYERLGHLSFLRINSGAVLKTDGAKQRLVRLAPAGTSDIILFFRQGKTVFVELKKHDGKLTKEQREFGAKMERLGYNYHIARSIDDIKNIIRVYAT